MADYNLLQRGTLTERRQIGYLAALVDDGELTDYLEASDPAKFLARAFHIEATGESEHRRAVAGILARYVLLLSDTLARRQGN